MLTFFLKVVDILTFWATFVCILTSLPTEANILTESSLFRPSVLTPPAVRGCRNGRPVLRHRHGGDQVGLLASGFWLLVSGFWFLVSGFWFLVSGFWLLVSGFWILAFSLWPNGKI